MRRGDDDRTSWYGMTNELDRGASWTLPWMSASTASTVLMLNPATVYSDR